MKLHSSNNKQQQGGSKQYTHFNDNQDTFFIRFGGNVFGYSYKKPNRCFHFFEIKYSK